LEKEISKIKKYLHKSKERTAFFRDYISNLEEKRREESAPIKGAISQERSASRDVKALSKDRDEKNKPIKIVDIKDMVIQKEGSKMTVNFKVVNVQPGETPAGGYIHIIARSKKSIPPKDWPYPEEKLQDGVPVNYRRGQLFLIQRF